MNSQMGLRRGLLGYRTRLVDELVEQHRATVSKAVEELQAQRTRTAELERAMSSLQAEVDRLRERSMVADALEVRVADLVSDVAGRDAELEGLQARLEAIRAGGGGADREQPTDAPAEHQAAVGDALREELQAVLLAAEQAATRIVERAEETSRLRMQESEATRAEVEADARELEAWRGRLAPLAGEVSDTIERSRADAQEAAARIEEQVERLTRSLGALQSRLGTLNGALSVPAIRVRTPGGGNGSPASEPTEGQPGAGSPHRVIDLTTHIDERWDHVYELFEPHRSSGPETF
jgi:chromosome segregation ATPase